MGRDRSIDFSGTIIRFEPDGFGLVRFDAPIGPYANNYGVFSNSTHTTIVNIPFIDLKTGMRIKGTADPDKRDVAEIKSVTVPSNK